MINMFETTRNILVTVLLGLQNTGWESWHIEVLARKTLSLCLCCSERYIALLTSVFRFFSLFPNNSWFLVNNSALALVVFLHITSIYRDF